MKNAFLFSETSREEPRKDPQRPGEMRVEVVRAIAIPKGYHEGILFEGGRILVNNGEKGKTWVVSASTGEVLHKITPPATFTEGITAINDNEYYVTDWDTRKVYLVGIKDNKMVEKSSFSLEPARPTGITWDGSHLYVITWTRGMGTKYHLVKINKKGKIVGRTRIKKISEPSQIAWDGKNLWISSWYSGRVYRVNPETLKIEGYFQPPMKDTTGLAWDGEYLWVTGTNSDLYQVRVLEE